MRKLLLIVSNLILLPAALLAAPGPNEVCVNDNFTYSDVDAAFQFMTSGDIVYFHEQTYDWTYSQISKSCEIDGIADKSIAELNMSNLTINGTGSITVTIKDMIFRGGGEISVGTDDHVIFENCTFENTAYNQVDASGGSASWSNVEFANCIFNRTGAVGQNIRFYGDVSMDNCNVNEVQLIQIDNDITIVNSHFLDSKLSASSSGFSTGRHNVNYLSNVTFENSDLQLGNRAERTLVEDLVFDALSTQFDYRIKGDTCEVYGIEADFASSFTVDVSQVTKKARIIVKDVHIELLTDSYFNVKAKDTSFVQLENIVIDQSNATTFGFYIIHGLGSVGSATDCSISGGGRGFYTTRPGFNFVNCHASNCTNKGFEIRGGTIDRCSAIGCDYGVYTNGPTGDVTIMNTIIADGTNNGIHFTCTSTSAIVDFDCINNTIVNNDGYGAYFEQASGSTIKPTIYFANNISVDNTGDDLYISSNIRNADQYEIRNSLFGAGWTAYTGYDHRDCIWNVAGSYHDTHFDAAAAARFDQLRPLANSVAVDNGLDVGWDMFDYSFDGTTKREHGAAVDMGAQEFNDSLPHLKLSTPEPFWEGEEDGQVIDVEAVNTKFDSVLNVSNWTLLGAVPVELSGLISLGSVTFIDSTHAQVTLSGSTPYLVWPLMRNQYNLGLQAGVSELQGGTDAVQGKGVLYLKAGEPIPDVREIYRFHDQTNMMFSYEYTTSTLPTLMTTDIIDNIVEFNIEVPSTGIYEFEWRFNTPTSSGIERIYQDDDLVLVQNESPLAVGSWATQTMDLSLTEGFHRMKFHFAAAGIEIEWFEFKDLITANTELEVSSVNVFPVPVKDQLIIESTYEVSGYELRDMNGHLLLSGSSLNVDTHSLSKGAYILNVLTSEGYITKKVIK